MSEKIFFDRISREYSRKDTHPVSGLVRRRELMLAARLVLGDGAASTGVGRLLDIGCGVGAMAWHLEGRYETYLGLDISSEMIRIAQGWDRGDNVSFQVADILQNPPDVQVDTIGGVGVLHHISDLDVAFTNMLACLRPGGMVFFVEPHRHNPIVLFLRFLRKKFDSSYDEKQQFVSTSRLRDVMQRKGFTDIHFIYYGFFAPPLGEVPLSGILFTLPLAKFLLKIDKLLFKLPEFLKKYISWNLVVIARRQDKNI